MTTWDKVLIAMVLAATVASVFLVPMAVGASGPATTITVTVDGEPRERLPLDADSQTLIRARKGYCRLEIKDGLAGITATDCPKNLCVNQASLGAAGGVIVCLPHRIVISVESSRETKDEVDAVVR